MQPSAESGSRCGFDRAPYVGIIVNPNSRGNRRHFNRATHLQRAIGPHGTAQVTANVIELAAVMRQWLDGSVTHLFADGGDGTLHWMIRTCAELLAERYGAAWPYHMPTLIAGSAGTINFAADYLGTNRSSITTLKGLRIAFETNRPPSSKEVQLMEVTFKQQSDASVQCYGFVLGVGGIAGNFFDQYYKYPAPSLSTALRIVVLAIASLPLSKRRLDRLLRPTRAQIVVDEAPHSDRDFNSIHAATIPINLKMLKLFPQGFSPSHIQLLLGSAMRHDVYKNIWNLIMGWALKAPKLKLMAVTKFSVDIQEPGGCLLVIDGEIIKQVTEVTVSIGPKLRFVMGA